MVMTHATTLGFELTSRCNLSCKHCLRDGTAGPPDLDFEIFKSIVTQAARMGRFHFAFTGGEPTLYPRFFDCLEFISSQDLTCHLVTNGQNFPELRTRLMEYAAVVTGVSISLDGATRPVADEIRGTGSFDRTLMAIALAVSDGWPTTVQFVVNAANMDQMEQVADLCGKMGVSTLLFAGVLPTGNPISNSLVLSHEQLILVAERVEVLAAEKELPIGITTGHCDPIAIAHCETMRNLAFNVDYRGRLTFCCQLSGVAGDDSDVVADLSTVPLAAAMGKHVALVAQVIQERLQQCEENSSTPGWNFHCDFCFKRFAKR